jgi:hypothetical protein
MIADLEAIQTELFQAWQIAQRMMISGHGSHEALILSF